MEEFWCDGAEQWCRPILSREEDDGSRLCRSKISKVSVLFHTSLGICGLRELGDPTRQCMVAATNTEGYQIVGRYTVWCSKPE